MAKMPKNDNLVMESIEDLFQQADIVSENPASGSARLSREQARKIPIIGARPIRLEKDTPPGSDILVLAGQKRPLSEQSEPFFSTPPKKEKEADPQPSDEAAIQPESEDPFLAIRQAVLSASDKDSTDTAKASHQKSAGHQKSASDQKSASHQKNASHQKSASHQKNNSSLVNVEDKNANPLDDQKFADQIARLIDREIELRLKAQLSILTLANHPAKAATQAEKPEKKSRKTAARKPAPTKAKAKKAATGKVVAQKSTAKKASAKKALKKQTAARKTPAKKTARTQKKS